MIKKYYGITVLLSMCATICFNIHSCIITFINDSCGKTLIRDIQDETIYPLSKNDRRRLGHPHKLAEFEICVKDGKANVFKPLYSCKQKMCGKNGNPHIKFSDIKNGSGQAVLFVIEKKALSVPMVRRLPIITGKPLAE